MTNNIITENFSDLPDPRVEGRSNHLLIEIIILSICAVVGGANTWTEIETFCKAKINWFKKFLKLEYGIPSHDTFGRVFSLINPEDFRKCFLNWINAVHKITKGEIIPIDGKTLRRSYDSQSDKPAIHMVSAWASKAGLVLGQIKVDEKTNEIKAIPKLLKLLAINNCIVTIDAMGCQKEIAKDIIKKNADYVLALKNNQGNLYKDVKLYFDDALRNNFKDIKCDHYKSFDNDHGRIENRKYWITDDINWIFDKDDWKGFKTIGIAISEIEEKNRKTKELRYYISSLEMNAKIFGNAVRGHWGIENSLHWVLDISFREDENRVRKDNAPENQAVLRHIALNMIKKDKSKGSIRNKRLKAGWNEDFLEKIIFKKI